MLVVIIRRALLFSLLVLLGALFNVVVFATIATVLAGANGEAWIEGYLSIANGYFFLAVSILIAAAAFPFARRLPFARTSRRPVDPPLPGEGDDP